MNILCDWLKKGVRVISISQQIDFNGDAGQLVASVMFALAQMERENLRENVKRGLTAAKARGVKLGRPHSDLIDKVVPLLEEGYTVAEVAKKLHKTRQGIYDCLRREGFDLNKVRENFNKIP
ncbi:Transposon Tn3 resolvase [subsurface metagenome]